MIDAVWFRLAPNCYRDTHAALLYECLAGYGLTCEMKQEKNFVKTGKVRKRF